MTDRNRSDYRDPWDDRNPLELYGGNLAKRLFERTRNGLFAMDAYEDARCHCKPIPEWVLGYLDEAARKLRQAALKQRRDESIGNPSEQVARAFLIKAGPGNLSPFEDCWVAW